MASEFEKIYSWNNNAHNFAVAECFSILCAKSLLGNEQPDPIYCDKCDSWCFENLTPVSEKVFLKVVYGSLERVPKKKNRFQKLVSTLEISDIEKLIDLNFEWDWSVYRFPRSDEWTFFFEDTGEALFANLSI